MRALGLAIATGAYTGYVPFAPGTVGTVAGLLLLVAIRATASAGVELAALAAVTGVGVWAAGETERRAGIEDPGIVVVDEVAGILLTLLWIPLSWVSVLSAFLMFRVLDIIKPYPARRAERLPGGWGIMADDLIAAVYAHAVVRFIGWVSVVLQSP